MSDKIDSYVSKRYEELKLDYLINNQIPTTVEEYKKLEESITSVAGENEHLKQSFLDLLTKDYSGLISQAPEVPDITDGVEKSTEVTYSFSYEKLDDIPRKLSEIESAYKTATDALAEYDEKGYYSMETIDAIIGLENEYISALLNSEGQIQISKESINNLAEIKLEASKASLYQEACEELVRIKTLDTALAAQELALINGTLTQSAYETAKALYEEVSAMGGANAALAGKVWDATTAKVALLDNQIASLKSNTYSVGKAVGDSSKSSVKVLEAELDALDASMEAGYIDFSDYIGKRKALIDDYYNQGKIKAADYYNYLKGHYEQELKYYNSALKAITNLLDSEIDSWKKKIDEVETENDFLNSKLDDYNGILDVVNDVYDTEIEGLQKEQSLLQDKIDAIRDTNDALDEQKRKEEAIYALRRAEENHVKKVYVGSEQGFIYTEDHSAVREAQDNLHEIETEEAISKIEDEINNYQKLIDQLEDFKGKWNEVLDAHTNSVNRQLAISLWGQNYENVILSNRISDIETFKSGYVSIQEQINSNESLINSYNEKIEYYSALKNEWSSISTAREVELERQHAADVLGQNWEAEVLSGRTDNLNKFKTAYISIQQALADAAWNSANEQIKAAKEASKAAQGSYGSAGSVGSTEAYEVVYEEGAETVKVFDNKEEAQEYADKMSEGIDENEPSYYVKKLPTHHDGLKSGLVGAKNNNDNFSVLEKWGLKKGEVPEILKRGEAVLNQMQIDNVAYPLRMFGDLVKVTSPDTSYMKNIQNNRNVEQNITINNSFPNVNNDTGYENFSKHMSRFAKQLYLDAVQYTHRR